MSDDKEMLGVEVYPEGIRLSFDLTHFPEWKFQALTKFIQRNRELKKIEGSDLYLDKEDMTYIIIRGVSKEQMPEFFKCIEFEILQSITPHFSTVITK